MKIIKKISGMIDEELDGARSYAVCALKYRDEHPELSKTLYTIAGQEMQHVDMLHAAVAGIIMQYRKEHGEPPEAMKAIYDYLHEQQINKAAEVKTLIGMYR